MARREHASLIRTKENHRQLKGTPSNDEQGAQLFIILQHTPLANVFSTLSTPAGGSDLYDG